MAIASGAALGLIIAAPLLAGMAGLLLALIKIRKELRGIGTDSQTASHELNNFSRSGPDRIGGRHRRNLFGKAATSGLLAGALSALNDTEDSNLEDKIGLGLGAYNPLAGAAWEAATNLTQPGGMAENSLKRILGARPGGITDRGINWLFADKLTNRSYDPNEHYNQREYAALKGAVRTDDHRAKVIAGRLSENGFNQAQIAGILANFSQESRFSTTAQNGSHAGLAQWDRDRQEQFRKRYGHALTDGTLSEQVDFFTDDLKKHRAAWSALSAARTPEEAGFAIGRHYEIPGVTDATLRPDVNARAKAAGDWSKVAAAWGRGSSSAQQPAITVQGAQSQTDDDRADGVRRKIVIPTASAPPIQIVQASQPSLPEQDRQRSGQTDSGRTQGTDQPHRVTIDINHQNAPAGVQVRTSSNSDQVGIGRLKVHRAMSPDAPSL